MAIKEIIERVVKMVQYHPKQTTLMLGASGVLYAWRYLNSKSEYSQVTQDLVDLFPQYYGNEAYLSTLKNYVSDKTFSRILLVHGPHDVGKSLGILKCEVIWNSDKSCFVIDINMKSSNMRTYQQFIRNLELKIITYMQNTRPNITCEDITNLFHSYYLPSHTTQSSILYSALHYVSGLFPQALIYSVKDALLNLLEYEQTNKQEGRFVFPFLIALLDLLARKSQIKPILVIRDLQQMQKWGSEVNNGFTGSFDTYKEGWNFPIILETSDNMYVYGLIASRVFNTVEVTGWEDPCEIVVNQAKLFTQDECDILHPILGGNPGLWMNAYLYKKKSMPITHIYCEFLGSANLRLARAINSENKAMFEELRDNGNRLYVVDKGNKLLTTPAVLSLLASNILYIDSDGYMVPENSLFAHAISQFEFSNFPV